jgi:TetR/AcrR family transcriptional regulator
LSTAGYGARSYPMATILSTARSAKPGPRRQGRPTAADAGVGKAAIVEAARQLLRTVPPAKVTRSAVARAAGIDPALVRYYFGDMTGLFTAVALAIAASMRQRAEASLGAPGVGAAERLRGRIRVYLDTFAENPYFHQLFAELVLHRDSAETSELRRDLTARSFGELSALLGEAKRAPGAKPVDPRFVYLALFGILEFFVSGRPVLEELFPPDAVAAPRLQEDYAEFVADLFIRGIGLTEAD